MQAPSVVAKTYIFINVGSTFTIFHFPSLVSQLDTSSPTVQQDIVNKHNELRRSVTPTTSTMLEMVMQTCEIITNQLIKCLIAKIQACNIPQCGKQGLWQAGSVTSAQNGCRKDGRLSTLGYLHLAFSSPVASHEF